MKKLLVTLPLLLWSALAGAYVIDFEEFAPGTAGPVVSGGYVVSGSCPVDGCLSDGIAATANTYAVIADPGLVGPGKVARITVARQDGGVFALYSLDIVDGPSWVYGETATGGSVIGQPGDFGQGDWLNLVSFRVEDMTLDGEIAVATSSIDNIVVNVVPIPAAVWLFGSGLLGLGFVRWR